MRAHDPGCGVFRWSAEEHKDGEVAGEEVVLDVDVGHPFTAPLRLLDVCDEGSERGDRTKENVLTGDAARNTNNIRGSFGAQLGGRIETVHVSDDHFLELLTLLLIARYERNLNVVVPVFEGAGVDFASILLDHIAIPYALRIDLGLILWLGVVEWPQKSLTAVGRCLRNLWKPLGASRLVLEVRFVVDSLPHGVQAIDVCVTS